MMSEHWLNIRKSRTKEACWCVRCTRKFTLDDFAFVRMEIFTTQFCCAWTHFHHHHYRCVAALVALFSLVVSPFDQLRLICIRIVPVKHSILFFVVIKPFYRIKQWQEHTLRGRSGREVFFSQFFSSLWALCSQEKNFYSCGNGIIEFVLFNSGLCIHWHMASPDWTTTAVV